LRERPQPEIGFGYEYLGKTKSTFETALGYESVGFAGENKQTADLKSSNIVPLGII
jgi:hypothetical protein